MPRTRQFTIGAGMLAIAVTGVACGTLVTLTAAWEPLSYYIERILPEMGSWTWFAIMVAMVFLGPFLLVGLGLVLFPINTDEPVVDKKPANPDLDDL